MADICNVHAEKNIAVFQLLKAHGIVEILRVAPVDGEGQQTAHILARRIIRQVSRTACIRFTQYILREIGAQTHAHHQCIKRAGCLLKTADSIFDADT